MTKDECITTLKKNDKAKVVYDYCLHKGKEIPDINKFMIALIVKNVIIPYYEYAFDELCREFNLIILSDKSGNIIDIY